MAPLDPKTWNIFVWLLSCLLFGVIIAGCVCLILYIVSNNTGYAALGLVLVAIPWMFWLVTFLYRCVSRSFLGRGGVGVGIGGGGASRKGGPTLGANVVSRKGSLGNDAAPESGGAPRVRFGDAVVIDERKGHPAGSGSGSSTTNTYDGVNENERPLASTAPSS